MDSNPKFAAEGSNSNQGVYETGANGCPQTFPHSHSAALEAIWRSHSRQLLRVTERITNNREDAEDALQDSFLRAHIRLHSFDGRSSVATWLTRIAINSALMILRKRHRGPQLSIADAIDSAVGKAPNPEEAYDQREREEAVRSGIRRLGPAIRRAIEIQALEEHSTKETAEKMGLSIAAAKSRISRARAELRKSVEPKIGNGLVKKAQLRLAPASLG
jgi:RNA polymerase sigma factor (sigma-70 family)